MSGILEVKVYVQVVSICGGDYSISVNNNKLPSNSSAHYVDLFERTIKVDVNEKLTELNNIENKDEAYRARQVADLQKQLSELGG